MRNALLAMVVTLLAAGVTARPQEPVAATRAEIVRLDAVVTDGDGQLVRDLTADDFELFEDGKPQELSHFLFTGGEEPTAAPGVAAEPGQPGGGQHIVIVVDNVHLSQGDLAASKDTLRRVAHTLMKEDNKVALLTTTSSVGSYRFVEDLSVLRERIEGLGVSEIVPPAPQADMTPVTAEMILRGDRSALILATRRLIDDPSTAMNLTGPRAATTAEREPTMGGIDPSEKAAADEARRQARGILLPALRFSALTMARLEGIVRGLAALPGRKSCLLLSDGFLMGDGTSLELERDLERIVDAATRSGTVVYALDAEGLPVTASGAGVAGVPSRPGLEQSVARQGEVLYRRTLETISGGTGGFLIRGASDIESGVGRMLEENAAHYVMAYEPTNTKRDGKFRKIEVKLPAHRDYTVRTRKGYLAPDEDQASADQLAGFVPLSDDAVWALLEGPLPESDIPVQLTSGFLDRPPLGSQVLMRANVDLRAVSFREEDSRHRGTVELLGGVFDDQGRPVGEPVRRHAELDWSDPEYEHGLVAGLPYEEALPLDPGRYQVRLFVRDAIAARVGEARQWVDVPDLSDKGLAMSSVFLGSEAQAARGVRRFKRSEDLSFQLYVYNPRVDASGQSDVVMQTQIWRGEETIAASKPEPVVFREEDGVPEPQGNSFPLATLEPGSYELKVVVVDRKAGATINGTADFTVE